MAAQGATLDYSATLNRVSTAMIVLVTAFVLLRFVSRRFSHAGLWYDDWLALASLPVTIATSASFYFATSHGYGTEKGDVFYYLKVVYVDELLWYTSFTLTKLSVLCFYNRVFGSTPGLKIALKIIAAIILSWWIALFLSSIFQCKPISDAWMRGPESKCFGLQPFFLAQTVPNLITDFAILFIPLPILWRLHLRLSRKVTLILVFLVSYFVPIISIVRIIYFIQLGQRHGDNSTYDSVLASIWSILEPSVALISVCIPSLSWLFKETMTTISDSFYSLQSKSTAHSSNSKPFSHSTRDIRGKFSNKSTKIDGNDSFKQLKDEHAETLKSDQYQVSASGGRVGHPATTGPHDLELDSVGPQIYVRDDMNVRFERAEGQV